ncbi:MAG: DMT family transporter [Candidatus Cyclonatronum sp.]|uniref:DMT family transporter n=1 Tax=Cyclonatronum sp. TaxID=3024185 RepID=UPI0025BB9CC9|nr:DMT family transporter [Cyclonatronum sp.]MCH8487050.1 DMT family transporter [Cyclonatronum sp.]
MSTDSPSVSRLVLLLGAGMATFAFAPILVRYAGDTDPVFLACIRTVSAALILLPFWLRQRAVAPQAAWSTRDNLYAGAAGLFLALHFVLWFASLSFTSVASASVLVTIHPIILIVVESATGSGRFGRLTWLGVFTAFGGSLILGVMDTDPAATYTNPVLGNLFAVAAAVMFVFYLLLSRRLRAKGGWLDFVFRVYSGTALGCLLILLLLRPSLEASLIAWVCGIALAIGPQILGHGSLNYSVKFVAPTLLSTLILIEPVFAILLAGFLFSEIPSVPESAAMLVIMAGVGLSWFGGSATPKTKGQ